MCGIECFNTITVRALFKDIRNGKLPPKGELLNFVMNYHVVSLTRWNVRHSDLCFIIYLSVYYLITVLQLNVFCQLLILKPSQFIKKVILILKLLYYAP